MNTKLLKQKILDLAIRGKLTQQLKSDGTAADLLKEICDRTQEKTSLRAKRGNPSPQTIIPLDKSEAPFEIPANWEWVRLGDVAKKITDGTHHSPVNLETGDFMYVTAKNIKDDGIHLERCNPEKGDVLLIKDGATTGVVTVNNLEEPFSLLSSVALLKLGSSIESWYLAFVIRSTLFNQMIRSQMKGVGITRVTLKQIESFAFPLPPLAEQQRIVAKIEEAFAEIDAIEKNKELLKNHIKQARQKILDLAIHGKLVPQNKSDESASVLLERITRDNPHYEKLENEPFEIPENWAWCKLGNIAEINPKNKLDDDLEVSFIPMNLIEAGYSNRHGQESKSWKDVKKRFTHFAENDVALAKISPCFENKKSAIMRNLKNGYGAGTTELFIFRPLDVMVVNYLLWIFKSDNFIQAGTGNFSGVVGQQRLSREVVENYPIPLPPLNEQFRIIAKIEELFSTLDQMERNLV